MCKIKWKQMLLYLKCPYYVILKVTFLFWTSLTWLHVYIHSRSNNTWIFSYCDSLIKDPVSLSLNRFFPRACPSLIGRMAQPVVIDLSLKTHQKWNVSISSALYIHIHITSNYGVGFTVSIWVLIFLNRSKVDLQTASSWHVDSKTQTLPVSATTKAMFEGGAK